MNSGALRAACCAAALAVAAVQFIAGGVNAQQDDGTSTEGEPWALSLAAQLHAEKRCDVQATYFVREMPSAEGTLYSGRVRCIDGREFDFSQSKPHLKFDLKACEPAAC
ncbi:MAG: hypothetical protein AB7S74_15820 [Hyphomicrobium sp.]